MIPGSSDRWNGAKTAAVVAFAVLVTQLGLVAAAGTDIPFQDQWNVEGQILYPRWLDGTLDLGSLLEPWNEHRILWTHLGNLALFATNGQWDPLVQLVALAGLRAVVAGALAGGVARMLSPSLRVGAVAGLTVAFLPHLAWHEVLWAFESQVVFCLGFSLATLGCLGRRSPGLGWTILGLAAGLAAQLAMGGGALVPVALLGLVAVRIVEARRFDGARCKEMLPALGLLAVAALLRTEVPAHAALRAHDVGEMLTVLGRILSWPFATGWPVAVALNAPLLLLVAGRIRGTRRAVAGEDALLAIAFWSIALASATAYARGGGAELAHGVPSRYVDFIVLLPWTNLVGILILASEIRSFSRRWAVAITGTWALLLLLGWTALSVEVARGVLMPRASDRDAPVRLLREYQVRGDAAVFAGKPILLVPHPQPEVVRGVLSDPRLAGRLPPSLQPERPPGFLSSAVRSLPGFR